ncbi:MAG TPA: hypothetical protein VIL28_08350 [Steroidobacteraceae bacterium]
MSSYSKTLIAILSVLLTSLMYGCATTTPPVTVAAAQVEPAQTTNSVSPVQMACATKSCAGNLIARGVEIGEEKNAPFVEGHPVTSVVVTQCNLVVAVYMTMPDGRLLRFDKSADIPAEQLVSLAYTATRSERVEVSCNGMGVVGYEKHEPI